MGLWGMVSAVKGQQQVVPRSEMHLGRLVEASHEASDGGCGATTAAAAEPRPQKMCGYLTRGYNLFPQGAGQPSHTGHSGHTQATQATQATQPSSGVDACVDGDGGDHMCVQACIQEPPAPLGSWIAVHS